jgi:hypothetical protein
VLWLVAVPTAGATVQVLGQTASAANPPINCAFSQSSDEIQLGAASKPQYFVVPIGVLTSWSTFAGPGSNQFFTFKVFRKVAPFTYLVVARETHALAPGVLNTFPVAIPVQPGDFVGESQPGGGVSTPCVFETGITEDHVLYAEGSDAAVGSNVVFPGILESGYRLNVSATVLPPPRIDSISPVQGSVSGASVVIAGANFASVTGVAFGSVPAAGFTVDSEGQITAESPVSKSLAPVPLIVTTAAGMTTSVQTFAYLGCKVPSVAGRKLKAAKKKIRKAHCVLRKVKTRGDATAKTGKVVKQRPKPGRVLAPGAKVTIILGA